MKTELINPFLTAAYSVLEMVLGEAPTRGEIRIQPPSTSHQVNVTCGVTGQVVGHLVYGMSLATADKIAGAMIGQPVKTFDQLAASAIAELANMISGNGLLGLSEAGITADLTPPSIIKGTNVQISTVSIPAIGIPFNLEHGEFMVTVSLQQVK